MTLEAASPWSADLTALCERLARRLRSGGAAHPEVAAVALAVRGRHGVDRAELAAILGLGDAQLAAVESGAIGWSEVPASLRAEADRCAGLTLARLGVSGG